MSEHPPFLSSPLGSSYLINGLYDDDEVTLNGKLTNK